MFIRMIAFGFLLEFIASVASADLVVSVQGSNGESELSIAPGDPLDLLVMADGPQGDSFASFALNVWVSNGGVPVVDHRLGSAFDGGWDFSDVSNPADLRFEGATGIGSISGPGELVSISIDTFGVVVNDHYSFDVKIDFFDCDFFSCLTVEVGDHRSRLTSFLNR